MLTFSCKNKNKTVNCQLGIQRQQMSVMCVTLIYYIHFQRSSKILIQKILDMLIRGEVGNPKHIYI